MATKRNPKQSKSSPTFASALAQSGIIEKGNPKPSTITFDVIRNLRDLNPMVNVCIETLKHIVIKVDGHVQSKNPEDANKYEKEIEYATNLFEHPNKTESARIFWLKLLEDILTIDRGTTEFVRNPLGYITEIYAVDGATIKPNYDEYGILKSPAYYQYLEGYQNYENGEKEPDAIFDDDEISILTNSPSSKIGMYNYGKSPVERVILTILTSLNADNFNANTFNKNTLPPYHVNLAGASKQQLEAFAAMWGNNNKEDLWKAAFSNAENVTITPLRPSNQDMQYYEFSLWLTKIIVAAFEMSPQDIGLTMDVNRATGSVQQSLSKNQGLSNLLDIKEEWCNHVLDLLGEVNSNFYKIRWVNDELDKIDEQVMASIQTMYVNSGILLPDEVRQELGKDPLQEVRKQYGIQPEPVNIQTANTPDYQVGVVDNNPQDTKDDKIKINSKDPNNKPDKETVKSTIEKLRNWYQ